MNSLTLLSTSMGCQYGGTETYVQTLAGQLRGKIPDLRLVTGGSPGRFTSDYRDLLQRGQQSSCHFPIMDRQSWLGKLLAGSRIGRKISPMDLESLSSLCSLRKIGKFIQGCRVLEAHYPLDGLLFPFLPADVKKILHFHGAWPPPLFRKTWKYILRHTDCCLACSFYAREELLKVMPSATIEVLYNGVDVQCFKPGESRYQPACSYDSGCLKIGTVARLSRNKGIDILCRVARDLPGKVELFLAGPVDPVFSEELNSLAEADNIHLLGSIAHGAVPDFYRFLDCFVLPSRFEAFPLTILEAMASGCPVIATRVGGIPEMIGREEDGGLLFPVGDAAALKTHLSRLHTDRNLGRHLGEKGRGRVAGHFSLERTMAGALAIYERTGESFAR